MQGFPFWVEYYSNGWRFLCESKVLEDAIDEAKEFHQQTDSCVRVVDETDKEHFRTDGKSDFTNR